MADETSKAKISTDAPASTELESDADDLFEDGDIVNLSDSIESENSRRDARRKIEIYWEKKRLKEEFEDFDESEFGF
jgi:hypothetical protein